MQFNLDNFSFELQNKLEMTGILGEWGFHKLLDSVIDVIKNTKSKRVDKKTLNKVAELIANHQVKVYNFAHSIQFNGLGEPQQTNKHSISLSISRDIKQNPKNNIRTKQNLLTENELLNDNKNYLLLGDPGAGKTTTMRRLVYKSIYGKTPLQSFERIPVLFRFIELEDGEDFFCKIANSIGIIYETKKDERVIRYEEDKFTGEQKQIIEVIYKYYVGTVELKDFLPKFFNDSNIILFLDGIDEVKNSLKNKVWTSIIHLSQHQTISSKIILTCRSGEKERVLEGFYECEISSLTDEQISKISKLWLGKNNIFLSKLNNVNYRDLADRPLFLVHLLISFREEGELPINSLAVYERMINLVVWQWDRDRDNIKRISIYGTKFDVFQKINFLKDLAFNLLYRIKQKRFDSQILKKAYLEIYKKYNLSENEADVVVKEIESHNGLIVKTGYDKYEFSHLSIFEYLCADYLVKIPIDRETFMGYIFEYPAPVGLAVAMSPTPSKWLAKLLIKFSTRDITLDLNFQKNLSIVINRAIIERANFEFSVDLAFAIFSILSMKNSTQFDELVLKLIDSNKNVLQSINNCLGFYVELEQNYSGTKFVDYKLIKKPEFKIDEFVIPERISIPKIIVERIINITDAE